MKISNDQAADWFYNQALSLPVFVLSWNNQNNRPSGMIAGWNVPCSGKPLKIAVALWKRGYTHKIVSQSKEFVIAIPNKGLQKEIDFFSKTHGNKIDKFIATGIKTLKSRFTKTPILAAATANFECKVETELDCGDHILFIGEVLASYINKKEKTIINAGIKDKNRLYLDF